MSVDQPAGDGAGTAVGDGKEDGEESVRRTETADSAAPGRAAVSTAQKAGTVSFVGAGPGDARLLTLRAAELLARADVVVLDRTRCAQFLTHCREDVEIIDTAGTAARGETAGAEGTGAGSAGTGSADPSDPVGTTDGGAGTGGADTTGDDVTDRAGATDDAATGEPAAAGPGSAWTDADAGADVAATVTAAARAGRSVVRLVSGDPGIDGEVTEEAAACAAAGLRFEIVPGVSAAIGVPAHAGIPLTDARHREVRVIDAREAAPDAVTSGGGAVDWEAYGAGAATLVILGGEDTIGEVAKGLIAAGRAERTPVAMTAMGTTTEQRTVVSTLAGIAADAKAAGIEAPALTVVGDVVGWRDRLSWFETKPLFGWRVLVPRTKEQAAGLSEKLRSYGAVPEEVPTISVEPPRTPQQMERAVKGLVTGRYEWVVFTSTNAVRAIRERFEQYGLDARAFAGLKVAAVGEQTAAALVDFGVKPDLVPSGQQSSEGLLEVWPPYDADLDPINRILLPRADIATETLLAGLTALGWECEDVTAYRTVRAAPPPAPIREAIKGGGFDAVLFTSSSTVRNLIGIAGKPHNVTVIGVIGPQTAKTAREYGLRVDVMAPRPSVHALAEAVAEFGAKRRAAQVEAGDPLRKPSQMRRGARRRAK